MNLTTGQLAIQSGVGVETIRYYERKGLLPEPPRRASGYRMYSEDAILRVQFIRRGKDLGFSLKEIADLLALRAERNGTCKSVRKRADATIARIDRQIQELVSMRESLVVLAGQCQESHPRSKCPILKSLGENPDAG